MFVENKGPIEYIEQCFPFDVQHGAQLVAR